MLIQESSGRLQPVRASRKHQLPAVIFISRDKQKGLCFWMGFVVLPVPRPAVPHERGPPERMKVSRFRAEAGAWRSLNETRFAGNSSTLPQPNRGVMWPKEHDWKKVGEIVAKVRELGLS